MVKRRFTYLDSQEHFTTIDSLNYKIKDDVLCPLPILEILLIVL